MLNLEVKEKNTDKGTKPTPMPPRCIKAKLFHLNGQQSEIITIMPYYTSWGEPYEIAAMKLKDYVYCLAKHWVQIEKFEIEIGSIMDGVYKPSSIKYEPSYIPLDMVYHDGTRGEWVTREEAIKRGYRY